MTLRAGELRHRIVVDLPTPTQSDSGAESPGWTTLGSLRAAIEPIRGTEGMILDRLTATTTTRIRVRWLPILSRITPKARIRHLFAGGEVVYNVESIVHEELAGREVSFLCSSGANDG